MTEEACNLCPLGETPKFIEKRKMSDTTYSTSYGEKKIKPNNLPDKGMAETRWWGTARLGG